MWIQFINPLSMDIMDSLNLHTQKNLVIETLLQNVDAIH
jgi:hypothetical protein